MIKERHEEEQAFAEFYIAKGTLEDIENWVKCVSAAIENLKCALNARPHERWFIYRA